MNLASILILVGIAGLFVAAVRRTRKKGSGCCEQNSSYAECSACPLSKKK